MSPSPYSCRPSFLLTLLLRLAAGSDVWPISQLTDNERDKVSTICAELHASSILGTLAVPDMIESVSAIARSFEEVEKICIDCWT